MFNAPKVMNSRGFNPVPIAVSAAVGFIVLSLSVTLVNNFFPNAQVANATIPFNTIWPLAIAGVLIISIVLAVANVGK